MATIDETKKRILRVATKTPLTGKELLEKLNTKHPDQYNGDARSIGRPLGALVKEKALVKSGAASRPKYAKA